MDFVGPVSLMLYTKYEGHQPDGFRENNIQLPKRRVPLNLSTVPVQMHNKTFRIFQLFLQISEIFFPKSNSSIYIAYNYSTACEKVLIFLCMRDGGKCAKNTTFHARHMQDSCVIHVTFPATQRYR